jgi:hypothetical protein
MDFWESGILFFCYRAFVVVFWCCSYESESLSEDLFFEEAEGH